MFKLRVYDQTGKPYRMHCLFMTVDLHAEEIPYPCGEMQLQNRLPLCQVFDFMLLNVHGGEMAYQGQGQSGKGTRE